MSPRPPPGDDPRHPDRRPTAPASVVAPTPSEDQQPNEGIDRRRAGLPPAVSSAAPLPRNQRGGYRAHGIAGRGRGEWSHLPRDRHSEFNLADNIWAEVRPGTLPRAGRTLQETNTTAEFLDTEATAIPVPALSRDEKQTVMSLAEVISSANRNPVPPNASSSAERQPRPRKRRKLTPPNNVLSYAGPAIPLSSVQGPHHSTAIEHPHTEKEKSKSSLPCSPTGTAPLPAAAGKADVSVKRERSPSPVLPSAARPVTEGSIRFAPLPRECRSSTRNYQLNRSRWIKGETSKLQAKGLKVERVFVRDDGMVVDWTSSIPVMSDTLLPALAVEPSQAAGDEMEVDDHAAQVPSDSAESRHQHVPAALRASPTLERAPSVDLPPHIEPAEIPPDLQPAPAVVAPEPRAPPPAVLNGRTDNGKNVARRLPSTPPPAAASRPGSARSNSTDSVERLLSPDAMDVDEGRLRAAPPLLPRGTPLPEKSTRGAVPPVSMVPRPEEPRGYLASDFPTPDPTASSVAGAGPQRANSPTAMDTGPRPSPRLEQGDTAADVSDEFAEKDDMETAALDFLRQYIRTFDRDRSALAHAYSHQAVFSVQSLGLRSTPPEPRCPAGDRLKQGRLDVVAELLSLPAEQTYTAHEPVVLDYDVAFLGRGLGVLLVVFPAPRVVGAVRCVRDERFVLRRREWDEDDRATEGLWPIIAVCHQMTIRNLS